MLHYCEVHTRSTLAKLRRLDASVEDWRCEARLCSLGGKGGSSAPAAPDPVATAQAQASANNQNAAYVKALNLNNQSNPFGSQSTTQTGTDPTSGAPIYSTATNVNQGLQQGINSQEGLLSDPYNTMSRGINGLYGLQDASDNMSSGYANLNTGIQGLQGQINPGAAQNAQAQGQNAAYQSQMGYLTPQYNQQNESMQAQLANQGITPGSQAYNNATNNLSQQQTFGQNQAANSAILTGSQLGTQNLQNQEGQIQLQGGLYGLQSQNLAGAQNSMNSAAGMYGQTTSMGELPYQNLQSLSGLVPGYSAPVQSGATAPNIGQMYQNQYAAQLAGYNANQASSNQLTGGLFTLGAGAAMAPSGGFLSTLL
jgi:hypothetical protein